MSDGDFNEHRRVILGGIDTLTRAVGDIAKEQSRANTATETANARIVTRLDDLASWRTDLERQRREERAELEKRLRELEGTRAQALVIAALGSVVFGAVMALLARVVVR